jgi:hypothetical protein
MAWRNFWVAIAFYRHIGNFRRIWGLLAIGNNGATRIWGLLAIRVKGASTGASPLPMIF